MKCKYCGIKDHECDTRALVERSKPNCVVCHSPLFDGEFSFNEIAKHVARRGNYCVKCDDRADRVARKVAYLIEDELSPQ